MTEGTGVAGGVTVEHHQLADVVTRQLEAMLSVGNYDAVKMLLRAYAPTVPGALTASSGLTPEPPPSSIGSCVVGVGRGQCGRKRERLR